MLQEATKAINSAFNNSFIKKLSQYLHDCVREEVKVQPSETLKEIKITNGFSLKAKKNFSPDGMNF